MTGPSDKAESEKPFQYSLRTLLTIVTIAAVWLGLAKMSVLFAVASLVVLILILPILPFYFIGRSLTRNDRRGLGVACIVNGVLVVALPSAFVALTDVPGFGQTMSSIETIEWFFLVGAISLVVWAFVMAAREEEVQRAKENREQLARMVKSDAKTTNDHPR